MTKTINPTTDRFQGNASKSVTILSGQTQAEEGVNLSCFTLAGVLIPSMTGASVKFQGSLDGTNFYQINDNLGTAITITTGGFAGIYKLNAADFVGINWIKPVSASAEGADRAVTLIGADILNG